VAEVVGPDQANRADAAQTRAMLDHQRIRACTRCGDPRRRTTGATTDDQDIDLFYGGHMLIEVSRQLATIGPAQVVDRFTGLRASRNDSSVRFA
jgi:hypothetical protein